MTLLASGLASGLSSSLAPGLSGAGRRRAALSLLAALVLLPLLFAGWNLLAAARQLAANRDLAGLQAGLEERLGAGAPEGTDAGAARRSVFEGETIGVAGAALQAELAAIVESAEAVTVETEILPPEEGEGEGAEADPDRIRLRITFEAENDALQRILLAVEGHTKALLVRSLSIDVAGAPPGEGGGAAQPRLRATAVIEAGWRGRDP